MIASIIIPVYKRVDWVIKCLKCLNSQSFKNKYEIIVVDDGSPNEKVIKESIEQLEFKDKITFKYLKQSHSGPAAARNYGIKRSSGEIICFLDDDSMADKNWLTEITEPIMNAEADFVSGQTLSYYRDISLSLLLEKAIYNGKSWATCNIAYRRDVCERVGGFDESFPEPSWEDNDLALRVIWAGFIHLYNPRAVVYHPHEKTIEEYKRKCLLNGRGAAHFSRKYILKKPLWGIGTPIIMSRRLIYGFLPAVWLKKENSKAYIRFLWSFYSLKGFLKEVLKRDGEN